MQAEIEALGKNLVQKWPENRKGEAEKFGAKRSREPGVC